MKPRNLIVITVLVLAQLAALGCVILPARAFPKTTGSVTLAGLKEQIWIGADGHEDFYARSERIRETADHLTRYFRAHL